MLGFYQLGKFALGQAPSLNAFSIIASAGSFTITGQAAQAAVGGTSEVGTFTLTGQSAGLQTSMPAAVGAFVLSGQAALSVLSVRITAASTPAIRTRQWVTFAPLGGTNLGSGGPSAPPTFAISGQSLRLNLSMPAAVGAYTISGQTARLVQGAVLTSAVGVFTISGQSVNAAFRMPAAVGSFVITGQTSTDLARRTAKIRAFPRVGRNTISARPTGSDGIKIRAYGG